MRVLLTGFGPFPGAALNPSAALVAALARRRRPALADVEIATHIFATTYADVDRDLPRLLAPRPDVVLMFGVAGRARELRVETRARNAATLLFPDAEGRRPQRGVIAVGAPPARRPAAPFARLLAAARTAAAPSSRLSRNAGAYVCNYAYWRALEQVQNGRPLIQFVHIPPPARGQPRRGRARAPSLSTLVTAAEAILLVLVAASRR